MKLKEIFVPAFWHREVSCCIWENLTRLPCIYVCPYSFVCVYLYVYYLVYSVNYTDSGEKWFLRVYSVTMFLLLLLKQSLSIYFSFLCFFFRLFFQNLTCFQFYITTSSFGAAFSLVYALWHFPCEAALIASAPALFEMKGKDK